MIFLVFQFDQQTNKQKEGENKEENRAERQVREWMTDRVRVSSVYYQARTAHFCALRTRGLYTFFGRGRRGERDCVNNRGNAVEIFSFSVGMSYVQYVQYFGVASSGSTPLA